MEVTRTRRYSFRGVHRLEGDAHPERLHGHRYLLEVSVPASVDPADVDRLIDAEILPRVHAVELEHFDPAATGEVLTEWIDRVLRERLPDLHAVCLQETRKNRFVSAKSEARFV